MFANVYVSGIFVVLSIVLFIVMCYKGVHTGVAAIVSAFVAAFGSTNDLLTSMFTTFTGGVGSLVTTMFALFTVSGLLGYMMDRTGCSMAVGKKMIKWLGIDRCYLAISATAVILMLAGVGTFMYVVVVVALPLMKAANLPRRIGMVAAQGIAPAINFCMPVANVPGSIPNQFLGTTIYDAPVLSVATGVVGIVLFFFYITREVKKARTNGEHFTEIDGSETQVYTEEQEDLPNFWLSILPLLSVVIISILLSTMTKIDGSAVVVLAQLCACFLIGILHFQRCRKITFKKIVSEGVPSMWGFLVLAACVFAFGQVVATCAAFQPVQEAVLGLNINPYVSVMISVAVVAGLCADGIAAMMIWLPLFGQTYVDMGVNPGALRRLLLCTTQTFDSLPHAQSIAATLGLFGLTHKQGYKDLFITTVVFPVIFTVFCCICCIIFYPV